MQLQLTCNVFFLVKYGLNMNTLTTSGMYKPFEWLYSNPRVHIRDEMKVTFQGISSQKVVTSAPGYGPFVGLAV